MTKSQKIIIAILGSITAFICLCTGLSIAFSMWTSAEITPVAVVIPTETMMATEVLKDQLPTLQMSIGSKQILTVVPTQKLEEVSWSGVPDTGCIPITSKVQVGMVTEVIDGDTIRVSIDGVSYSVRYIGMDTPESGEPFGQDSKVKNSELVMGKNAILIMDVSETDPYDRLLRFVIADGIFVNDELVLQGFAKASSYPPDIACDQTYSNSAKLAKAAGLGFWAISSAQVIQSPTVVRSGVIDVSSSCRDPHYY